MVLRYEPLFVPSGGFANDDAVRVVISGALLGAHDPVLIVENEQCRRVGKLESSLTFLCDKTMFLSHDKLTTVFGRLHVFETVGALDAFLNWLRGLEPRGLHYEIAINVVPLSLGEAVVTVTTETHEVVRQTRTQPFGHRNAHCQGSQHMMFPFNASAGWTIDPKSIEADCSSSKRSSCNGVRNIADRSFAYSCTVANSGRCAILFRDARGSCGGRVRWGEVQSPRVLNDVELDSVSLLWAEDATISLPEGARSVRVAVEKMDGTRRVLTEQRVRDPWFDVEINRDSGYLIIRPTSLHEAMRNP